LKVETKNTIGYGKVLAYRICSMLTLTKPARYNILANTMKHESTQKAF